MLANGTFFFFAAFSTLLAACSGLCLILTQRLALHIGARPRVCSVLLTDVLGEFQCAFIVRSLFLA